ncbi:unnamed protein product (macronuclear) [Paramecium tetraurelia]|uniref:Protein kinase domain-containing protein n=1 Tax=Paramecium tetraurelia TaxID=5888 RepID=A0CEK6_PARTE|nr:uncharacterized protein GSPATT00037661001 [Paramecium tetraurelia]CAK69223.1 unnamed protein product [Paramecium tetraurelia]|eukprot:XP_001436620.1 hypothetical protein (macronuclear) [Paramecium tetraurelia strain d4-2]
MRIIQKSLEEKFELQFWESHKKKMNYIMQQNIVLEEHSLTSINWQLRVKMAIQLADGMLHLHKLNPPLIHRDLKILNKLLEQTYDSNRINIKIADFGLARAQADNGEQMTGVLGTFLYYIYNNRIGCSRSVLKSSIYNKSWCLFIGSKKFSSYEIQIKLHINKQFSTNPSAIMKLVTVDNGRSDLSLIQTGGSSIFERVDDQMLGQRSYKKTNFFRSFIQYLKGFQQFVNLLVCKRYNFLIL